ncbi:PREDICTED: division abnormally delayed protein isoform X1 [Dinoponera quadriceps]|uniref:Division abnormally delayed protein isoform X1 n=1 Tax=Dinoponera quadriceps TaxID=609295 RepID=A0A6P3X377_DINQU|nr:PREDICTED: division abnormally delayed protein isoform X1 [Dinoponera quadriceps]
MKITPRAALSAPVLLAIVLLVVCDYIRPAYARSSLRVRSVGNNTDFLVAVTTADCERVRPFFDSKNVTLAPADETARNPPKTICGGKCCSDEMEKRLKQQARTDFHNLIHHHSRTLQGLLVTTADSLRDSVTDLARQSENTTLVMFHKAYSSMEETNRPSVSLVKALYQMIVDYVSPSNTPDTLQQPLSREMLQEHILDFFTRLFPIVYVKLINPQQHQQDQQEFANKFQACLLEAVGDIQPFGDIPQEISLAVSKSLEATRVLVQALTLGKTVLERTDSVLFGPGARSPQQEACNVAMLRMTYCPKCKGFGNAVMPCNGFCINVMRGCLTEPASELDLAWSGYVETVERLVVAVDGHNDPLGLNTVNAVKQLGTRISDAILRSLENGPRIVEKVKTACGRSELPASGEEKSPASSDAAAATKSTASPGGKTHAAASSSSHGLAHRGDNFAHLGEGNSQDTKLYMQLGNFLASIVRSRIFYGTLADSICEDYPEQQCWNGERVGEDAAGLALAERRRKVGEENRWKMVRENCAGDTPRDAAGRAGREGRSLEGGRFVNGRHSGAPRARSRLWRYFNSLSMLNNTLERLFAIFFPYSKTVVDSSQTAQRYNPEFTITMMSSTPASYGNTNISALIDQLRHINQMVQSQLASSPDAGAFLGDEALDGSGSGDSPYWRSHNSGMDDDEDGDDRDDDDEASGSGMGPTTTDSSVKTHQNGPTDSGSSSTILLSSAVLAVVCASLIA